MVTMNMQGKVCLVTGASGGIGKVTGRELAKLGATVVMICRNRTKGKAAQAETKEVKRHHLPNSLIMWLFAVASGKSLRS